jgi:hypothetical protein
MSIGDLVNKSGISRGVIDSILKLISSSTPSTIKRLAIALGCDFQVFFACEFPPDGRRQRRFMTSNNAWRQRSAKRHEVKNG